MATAETIKDLATEVYRVLRGGYNETVYEEAMSVEFRRAGVDYRIQQTAEVFYKDHKVGEQALDFVVLAADTVVELKAVGSISKGHVSQLRAYLRTVGKTKGMVINFPPDDQDTPQFQHVDLDD